MNSIDTALQTSLPAVMVPRYEAFEELNIPGQRYLLAENGTFLEAYRAWIYARKLIQNKAIIAIPYGTVEECVRFSFGKLPKAMVAQFIEIARTRCPNECAAWVVWNEKTLEWTLRMLEETSVCADEVKIIKPRLGDDEHLVIDLHSHGFSKAGFSYLDNKDEYGDGGVKIAGVIGNLDKDEVTTEFRLCVNQIYCPIPFDSH